MGGPVLTADQARRAIYIDFEGRKEEHPVLLGVLYAEGAKASDDRLVLRQDIIDEDFGALANEYRCEGNFLYLSQARSLWSAINEIIRRARAQDRAVVAWSRHDRNQVQAYLADAGLFEEFEPSYWNGKDTAEAWLKETNPAALPKKGGHTLAYYMKLTGYSVPEKFGPGVVGTNLGDLRTALERRSCWDDLTDVQRRKWITVLEHNRHDLVGLRHVVRTAAS